MGNIGSCKELRLQNFYVEVVRIVSVLGFFKLLKNEESAEESFSFPFSSKYLNRNFKYLF